MRFTKAAANDYKKHSVIHTDPGGTKWQVDKNPYSTPGMRNEWQRGFDSVPPSFHERPDVNDWDTAYQRGRAMAELLQELQAKGQE